MWYNDILIILMGFVAILMIVMALVMGSRIGKPRQPEQKEPATEKVYVEKGFVSEPEPKVDPEIEEAIEEAFTPVYIDAEPPQPSYEEPPSEYTVEIETVTIEPFIEEPIHAPEPQDDVGITPNKPIIIEPVEPVIEEELSEEVVITPNETFYDPVPDETSDPVIIDESPQLEEELEPVSEPDLTQEESMSESEPEQELDTVIEPVSIKDELEPEPMELEEEPEEAPEEAVVEIEEELIIKDIPEVELPPLEPDETKPMPEEIEPEPEPELEPEPIVSIVPEKPQRRLRKPVIDESDPELKVDLGVSICPHCGSKVPDTIYCILCGKPLDPENAIGYEEEEET